MRMSEPASKPRPDPWCMYCYSRDPRKRNLVHKPYCLLEMAWDVEGTFCDCNKAYRCRSKFHRAD